MSSYTRWDRAAYVDRVGGVEEAERRRKALMARQSGEVSTLDAIVRYVEALGGRLDVVANFDDHSLTVTTTDAA